ncbi:MAG TPA: DoxX family membrane protein [Opitutaceae bacterium]
MHDTPVRPKKKAKLNLRYLLAAFFIVAGLNHFRSPDVYVAMIPPWLPRPYVLNAVSGVCEVMGGIGVLVPSLRVAAGWGLVALLVAVFPANLHVALMGRMPGFSFSPATLWLRLPFQAVLVAWVAWTAIADDGNGGDGPKPG